jgi:hypothetical protein
VVFEEITDPTATFLNQDYPSEQAFSSHLTAFLNGSQLRCRDSDTTPRITAEHQQPQERRKTPDITVHQRGGTVQMKYRELSDPFYIECKIGRAYHESKSATGPKTVHDNLHQYLKYKYRADSDRKRQLRKYGDRHVAVTCPVFLSGTYNTEDFESGMVNPAQLTRTLWKLGIGILYKSHDGYWLAFNQQEKIRID